MEDAHIAEGEIYALEVIESGAEGGEPTKTKIPLPGHAFFGVFDGHGGTFAAEYTGDNLCRILSKQPLFVEYAKFYKERTAAKKDTSTPESVAELRKGIELLEGALKQAFVDTDYEIAMALRGTPNPQANQPYHDFESPTSDNPAAAADDNEHPHDEDGDTNMSPTASDSIMAAAHQAAVNHARAMDDGDSGTTACCVMVTPDCLVCANAGDSRAVYAKKPTTASSDATSRVIPLSFDHKPDDEAEENRVRAAGGYVAGGRVEGDLAVSRGLGDFRFKYMPTVLADRLWDGSPKPNSQTNESLVDANIFKPGEQKVSPIPDIIVQTRDRENDEFIIVACDGIWDVRTNPECVAEVSTLFEEGESNLGLLCEEVSRSMRVANSL